MYYRANSQMYLTNCLIRMVPSQRLDPLSYSLEDSKEEIEIVRDFYKAGEESKEPPIFDSERPYQRVQLSLTWRSPVLVQSDENFIALLAERLTASVIAEKRRAYQVQALDGLEFEEVEERTEALALAKDILQQY